MFTNQSNFNKIVADGKSVRIKLVPFSLSYSAEECNAITPSTVHFGPISTANTANDYGMKVQVFISKSSTGENCSGETVIKYNSDSVRPTTSGAVTGTGTTALCRFSGTVESSEPGSVFECLTDGGAWSLCNATLTSSSSNVTRASILYNYAVGSGPHSLQVRAVDTAGNRSLATVNANNINCVPPCVPNIVQQCISGTIYNVDTNGCQGPVNTGAASYTNRSTTGSQQDCGGSSNCKQTCAADGSSWEACSAVTAGWAFDGSSCINIPTFCLANSTQSCGGSSNCKQTCAADGSAWGACSGVTAGWSFDGSTCQGPPATMPDRTFKITCYAENNSSDTCTFNINPYIPVGTDKTKIFIKSAYIDRWWNLGNNWQPNVGNPAYFDTYVQFDPNTGIASFHVSQVHAWTKFVLGSGSSGTQKWDFALSNPWCPDISAYGKTINASAPGSTVTLSNVCSRNIEDPTCAGQDGCSTINILTDADYTCTNATYSYWSGTCDGGPNGTDDGGGGTADGDSGGSDGGGDGDGGSDGGAAE
ncbi:MAG: hypothetical protein IPM57_06165 [Oligoflexia bacterium]|nr:hypothetical protein [Oligoflexia bacterium]